MVGYIIFSTYIYICNFFHIYIKEEGGKWEESEKDLKP